MTSNHFLDNTSDVRAAVSRANQYEALPSFVFFVGAMGEPGNEARVYLHLNLFVYIGPGSTNKPETSEKCNQVVQHTQS